MTDAIEVQLAAWGESSTGGRWVKFQLPPEGEHPFKGVKSGNTGGQRFGMALVRIDDSESTQAMDLKTDREADKRQEKTPGETARVRCILLCADKTFVAWLRRQGQIETDLEAVDWMRKRLGGSRSLIATDKVAQQKFEAIEMSFRYQGTPNE